MPLLSWLWIYVRILWKIWEKWKREPSIFHIFIFHKEKISERKYQKRYQRYIFTLEHLLNYILFLNLFSTSPLVISKIIFEIMFRNSTEILQMKYKILVNSSIFDWLLTKYSFILFRHFAWSQSGLERTTYIVLLELKVFFFSLRKKFIQNLWKLILIL